MDTRTFSRQRASNTTLHAPTCRVLVVDDRPSVAETMSLFLTFFGHEVRAAFSGASALLLATDFLPAAVILDISMPGTDGCEVAVKLRQKFQDRVLFIAVTALDSPRDRERCMKAGFDYFLVKPANPLEVEELIERFAGSKIESDSAAEGVMHCSVVSEPKR